MCARINLELIYFLSPKRIIYWYVYFEKDSISPYWADAYHAL